MPQLVSDEHREQVIEQLQSGFAGDHFEVDELERRLTLAQSATAVAQLDELVKDLVPTSTALVETKRLRVVLGSIERRGPWELPRHLVARVVFGNLELDLRDARIAPGVTEIEANVTFGNIEIIVPPGVSVDVQASSVLGNVEDRSHSTGARVVRITGRVKLGNLEVSTLQPGETKHYARRRERWERRAQRRAMRHAYRRSGW
jgi:hypothetical protein